MASDQSVTEFILFPPSVIKEEKDDRYGSKAIESGPYFNLFALEMEKRQAALGAGREATSKLCVSSKVGMHPGSIKR
ncbi:hypothetical protein [Bradyrhizobium sp. McL0615]|uniref:hypothetical protein n=1 Tax=Bradyrhizobium sp. McL0615 TaxID=3415673 RepID=UPI003CEB06CA